MYVYKPTQGMLANKTIRLTLDHGIDSFGATEHTAQLLKLFVNQTSDENNAQFLASFNVTSSEKKFSDMFRRHFLGFVINPDGSLTIVPQESRKKIINIVNALTASARGEK